jgi:hypothetical protein
VFLEPRKGYRAMTFPARQRIEVYARPGDDPQRVAHDIAHEIGHALDVTYNNAATRANWLRIRGIKAGTPWFGCNRCSDYGTPSGDFAEVFALLLVGGGHFSGRIAPQPTSDEWSTLAAFFSDLTGEKFPLSVSRSEETRSASPKSASATSAAGE